MPATREVTTRSGRALRAREPFVTFMLLDPFEREVRDDRLGQPVITAMRSAYLA